MLSAGGGCEITITTHVKTAWKKFRELLPVLTSCHLSYKTSCHVYRSCVQRAMLHASETWPLTKTNLQRNDRAMIRQICSIKPEDVATVRSSELLAKIVLEADVEIVQISILIGFCYDLSDTQDGLWCWKNGIYILW